MVNSSVFVFSVYDGGVVISDLIVSIRLDSVVNVSSDEIRFYGCEVLCWFFGVSSSVVISVIIIIGMLIRNIEFY